MRINIKHIKENDVFEIQSVEKKLRAHFLLTRAELNSLRTMLEKALLESRKRKEDSK
ncbi:MAG: hypothetical protein PHT95_06545 [Candidatus Omnitrophica bacterium]|nr:hypothetical protein [Candidatus Omnitrophota bacterium]MDD4012915.1 hypothetical protein [Candidatus Omnitrophota bacterium]